VELAKDFIADIRRLDEQFTAHAAKITALRDETAPAARRRRHQSGPRCPSAGPHRPGEQLRLGGGEGGCETPIRRSVPGLRGQLLAGEHTMSNAVQARVVDPTKPDNSGVRTITADPGHPAGRVLRPRRRRPRRPTNHLLRQRRR
jgi:hypothetical protein